jgi:bilirubin oxidase
MNRRNFIKQTGLGIGSVALGGFSELGFLHRDSFAQVNPEDQFARPFHLPPLNTGVRDGSKIRFDLQIRQGESNFIFNLPTKTLGLNGDYLGPVLRAKRGDRVSFNVKNNFSEEVALHWHGMMLPAVMDGGPHQSIAPGDVWLSEYEIKQAASTYWYHAHTHQRTGFQVYHGLAGLFIIDDDESERLHLPSEYGVDDIPIVIQDRVFDRTGRFVYLNSMHDRMMGMHGNTILVNGVVTPTFKTKKRAVRFRILNGCNARILNLGFSDSRPLMVIGGDGGLLPAPEIRKSVRLAPGERTEILIDFSDQGDLVLQHLAIRSTAARGLMGMGMMSGGTQSFGIMKIESRTRPGQSALMLRTQFLEQSNWQEVSVSRTRSLRLDMGMGPAMMMSNQSGSNAFSINGKAFDIETVNFQVQKNTNEIWTITNGSMVPHPFHVHNTQFKVLSRSSGVLAATEQGLKDTILVNPREQVRILVPFPEFSDSKNPYMYHCHILEHEDAGMMGQYTVEV